MVFHCCGLYLVMIIDKLWQQEDKQTNETHIYIQSTFSDSGLYYH